MADAGVLDRIQHSRCFRPAPSSSIGAA
jgi:hypothetical protein